jgi:glutamate N-acetyltransferase/amino-acid N-acetyltransferase
MAGDIRFVDGGTVTTPVGYTAGSTYAGLKTYAEDKLDLGLLVSQRPCTVAGMFTTSSIRSPSVTLTEGRVGRGTARALVVNSGIANACVGDQGLIDAQEATARTADYLGLKVDEVLIGSTGVIGVELPMALIKEGIPKVKLSDEGGHDLARAIMTTDTHPKECAVAFEVEGKTITIGGIAKGSGMIHPNMATMLCYITTDGQVETSFLRRALKEAVDSSLNMLSVDGDTSTNDTVLIFANGSAEGGVIQAGSSSGDLFQEGLTQLCTYLTVELARDGEGASRLIEVNVEGATTTAEARTAARTIVASNLVKSAVHGSDPNWGRVIAALGRSGVEVQESRIALHVNGVCIMEEGRPIPFHKDGVVVLMKGPEVAFTIKLNLGQGRATAWGCSLSEEYVTINSAYTT